MPPTYQQIQRQIETLQRQADKLKTQEVKGVIERVKVAIAHYGLTAEQLGFGTSSATSAKQKSTASAKSSAATAKYSDGDGKVWTGRGPRPHWLRDALASGRKLEEFESSSAAVTSTDSRVKPAKKLKKRRAAKTQYRDQTGNSWSGMGPKPRWLKDAIAGGAPLEQFAA